VSPRRALLGSTYISPADARYDHFDHGHVEVALVPGVPHGLHVQDPAAVAAVINPFIERLAARR